MNARHVTCTIRTWRNHSSCHMCTRIINSDLRRDSHMRLPQLYKDQFHRLNGSWSSIRVREAKLRSSTQTRLLFLISMNSCPRFFWKSLLNHYCFGVSEILRQSYQNDLVNKSQSTWQAPLLNLPQARPAQISSWLQVAEAQFGF